ncbi:MAG TPA: SMC-Scp complex subunit ScpB, partial [Bacteroidota bacterium]
MPETTVVTEHKSMSIPVSVKELLEALIFAASEPLTVKQLKNILQEAEHAGELSVEAVIETLNEEYQQTSKPFRIIRIAGGYQFATMPEYAEWVGKLYKEQGRRKLSQSSLETLAIIAYRQPITRPDIEAIRGVDCDYVLGTLLEKKLVTISGRAPTPGRPLLYGTTDMFLKHFGLNDITDLPKPREIEELLADSRYETERRMLEAQEQAEKEKKEEEDFKSRLPHIPKKKPDMDDPVEILHKKSGMDLTIKKEDADVVIQDAIEQTGLDTLEPVGSVSLQTNDLEETIESASEVQIEDDLSVDSPIIGYPPVEMTQQADMVEDRALDEQLEPQNSTQSDAPDATTSEVISNEAEPSSVDTEMQSETSDLVPEVPEVEPPNTDIVVRLTEDLISEQEEDEAFEEANAETLLQHEIVDSPAAHIEP